MSCPPKIKHCGREPYKLTKEQRIARSIQSKKAWAARIAKRESYMNRMKEMK